MKDKWQTTGRHSNKFITHPSLTLALLQSVKRQNFSWYSASGIG